jgi:hypothetical protein
LLFRITFAGNFFGLFTGKTDAIEHVDNARLGVNYTKSIFYPCANLFGVCINTAFEFRPVAQQPPGFAISPAGLRTGTPG